MGECIGRTVHDYMELGIKGGEKNGEVAAAWYRSLSSSAFFHPDAIPAAEIGLQEGEACERLGEEAAL